MCVCVHTLYFVSERERRRKHSRSQETGTYFQQICWYRLLIYTPHYLSVHLSICLSLSCMILFLCLLVIYLVLSVLPFLPMLKREICSVPHTYLIDVNPDNQNLLVWSYGVQGLLHQGPTSSNCTMGDKYTNFGLRFCQTSLKIGLKLMGVLEIVHTSLFCILSRGFRCIVQLQNNITAV